MTKTVMCQKLNAELPALSAAPYPGKLGQKIQATISEQAWLEWLAHQTMLINENRLSLMEPKARTFLREEMEKFLFGDGSEAPPGFVPE